MSIYLEAICMFFLRVGTFAYALSGLLVLGYTIYMLRRCYGKVSKRF